MTKQTKQIKKPKETGYETGKNGLIFWTTDLNLFYAMKKFLGVK